MCLPFVFQELCLADQLICGYYSIKYKLKCVLCHCGFLPPPILIWGKRNDHVYCSELELKVHLNFDFWILFVFKSHRAANAKLNNFSLLEPTLQLLGVQFNENVAHDIMIGKRGAATKLLYELYIALEKKRKTKLTGVAMEAMRPAAPARFKSIGSVSFREVFNYVYFV